MEMVPEVTNFKENIYFTLLYLPIFVLRNLNSCPINKNQSLFIHWSQTRTGLSHPRSGTVRLFMEQSLQTPRPQSRQWCRVTRGPN
jgi:hypothetical protein